MTRSHATGQPAAIPAAGRYRLDPDRCSVAFTVRHLFGLIGVSGTMALVDGDLVVEAASHRMSVSATVDAASFDTGSRRRDRDVRTGRFLGAEEYPHLTFRAEALDTRHGGSSLTGKLTVRDVTQPVTLIVDSSWPLECGFGARATTRVDRCAFGVAAARGMVSRHLDITVTIIGEVT
jgi:polyisoprenoid-binding protein YceI